MLTDCIELPIHGVVSPSSLPAVVVVATWVGVCVFLCLAWACVGKGWAGLGWWGASQRASARRAGPPPPPPRMRCPGIDGTPIGPSAPIVCSIGGVKREPPLVWPAARRPRAQACARRGRCRQSPLAGRSTAPPHPTVG